MSPKVRATSAVEEPPSAGAYYLDPRPDGSEFAENLYAFCPRVPMKPPTWQRKLHDQIYDLYAFVLNTDMTDVAEKNGRLKWLVDAYSVACVQSPATSTAPASIGATMIALKAFEKRLWSDLFIDMSGRITLHRIWAFGTGLILGLVGIGFIFGVAKFDLAPNIAVGNYVLVAAASMAGLFASDSRLKPTMSSAEYENLRERFRSSPWARVVGTCIVSIVAALAVSSEVVKITLGKWSSSNLPSDTSIALLVGFAAGVPGSGAITRFWKWISGSS